MHRIIVAILAAVDAAIAVAVGLAATLAPLTMLWVFGLGGDADWGVLWPAAVAVWQLGNLVPLHVALPADYLAATGIDAGAASFTLSLAPLAFAAFTAIFAARSGVRASRADAWATGVAVGAAVFAALTTAAALSSRNDIAAAVPWQAILVPALVFALPAVVAAAVTEWREAEVGLIARLRDRAESAAHGWSEVPALVARGGAVALVGLIGLGAAVAAVALFARAGQIVALFQAGNVDAIGATVLTIAQLAYVPTLAVWGMAFAAGPGFSVGAGTAVSPAGTQVGVVPGLPALGAIPESTTTWLLLLALVPVALGALAGWIARSRIVGERMPRPAVATTAATASHADPARTAVLQGLLAGSPTITATEQPDRIVTDAAASARLVIAAGIAAVAAAGSALLALAASGSLGPGRLAEFGPSPGPVALAVGFEVFVGAAILLLSPRARGGARRLDTEEPDAADLGAEDERAPAGARGAAAVWSGSVWHDDRLAVEPDGDEVGTRHPESAAEQDGQAAARPDDARTEPIDLPPRD